MKVLLVLGFFAMLSSSLLADARRVFSGDGRYHDGVVGRFSYLAELEIIAEQNGEKRLILREVYEGGGSSTLHCFLLQPSDLNHVFSGFKVLAPRSKADCNKGVDKFTPVGWGHQSGTGGTGIGGKETLLNIGNYGGWHRTSIYLIERDGKLDATSSSVGKNDSEAAVWFLTLEER